MKYFHFSASVVGQPPKNNSALFAIEIYSNSNSKYTNKRFLEYQGYTLNIIRKLYFNKIIGMPRNLQVLLLAWFTHFKSIPYILMRYLSNSR